MPLPLVILHGYSDTSASFQPIAAALARATGREPRLISLGDYVTLNDYVSFTDLLAGLDKAWSDHQLPREEASVDMVVHSTGALVARQWINRLSRAGGGTGGTGGAGGACPVKHLVMLAPANFGSPLAHKGQSFIGRIIKGSQPNSDGPLQSGRLVLKGLELASPFTWDLAQQDRFLPEQQQVYRAGRCLCTVLVGNRGYGGIMSMANEEGGDGTVRIATANMNCARLTLDATMNPAETPIALSLSTGRCGFGLLDRFNHSTIALKDDPSPAMTAELITRITDALSVDDAGFNAHCNRLDTLTEQTAKPAVSFQHTVTRCVDDQSVASPGAGRPVPDYNVAFREEGPEESGGPMARRIHELAVEHVHAYKDDPSYRAFYINTPRLMAAIDQADERLQIAVAAYPRLQDTTGRVGFKPIDPLRDGMDCARATAPADLLATYFRPHRTALVTIRLPWHRGDLVRFRRADEP